MGFTSEFRDTGNVLGITIEQGVIAAIVVALIGGVIKAIDNQIARKLDAANANVRFEAIEQRMEEFYDEHQRHQDDDRRFRERMEMRFDRVSRAIDEMPERIISRLREPKL